MISRRRRLLKEEIPTREIQDMGHVEFIDHTADVGMAIEAGDLNDLFRSAAQGLLGYIIANPQEIQAIVWDSTSIQADSLSELLVNWLNELIFLIETKHRVYQSFEVAINPERCELVARIAGEPLDSSRHQVDHEVKAVTRHEARVEQNPNGWQAQVLLDI